MGLRVNGCFEATPIFTGINRGKHPYFMHININFHIYRGQMDIFFDNSKFLPPDSIIASLAPRM
jgi:hypothetical protein